MKVGQDYNGYTITRMVAGEHEGTLGTLAYTNTEVVFFSDNNNGKWLEIRQ